MKFIIVFILLSLTACSSVPYATMMRFAETKPEDFFTVAPSGIRVKVILNQEQIFDVTQIIHLSATVEDSDKITKFDFPLELVSVEKQAVAAGFFSKQALNTLYFLKLSPIAINQLKAFHNIKKSQKKLKIGLSAGVSFSKTADNRTLLNDDIVLSVAIQISAQDSFIVLLDKWHINSKIN
jgi:hypothetical protein